jgi:hypothetical protein
MSIHQLSVDDASTRDERSERGPAVPANSTREPMGDDRFPKVDDILERLTHHTEVTDPQDD